MDKAGTLNKATAAVSARDAAATCPEVVFYQLTRKFVDNEKSIPDEAKDVMYYTLAVGHHTGVIDCFEEKLRTPLSVYESVLAKLPEGDARYKLEGILRSSEIQIEQHHLQTLLPCVQEALEGETGGEDEKALLSGLMNLFNVLVGNVAAYIMGRVRVP